MEEVRISRRLHDSLKAFCKANGMEINEYVESVLSERLSLDKFGDMNEMIKKPEIKKTKTREKAKEKKTPASPVNGISKKQDASEVKAETDVVSVDAQPNNERATNTRKRVLKVK